MMTRRTSHHRQASGRARGFTLVELMVTVAIALFLLGGLVMIVQNTRQENLNQQSLAMLQDEQRFAMTVLTDVIQQGGYYPSSVNVNPIGTQTQTENNALPGVGALQAGQAFYGSHPAPAPDSVTVRYQTQSGDGLILCDGSTNNSGAAVVYTNVFTVVPPAGAVPGQLQCSLNGNAAVTLVNGVKNLVVYYGVNRSAPAANYNVDTYLTADQMNAAGPVGGDWMNVSSVRIVLTFTNPLCPPTAGCQAGQQQTITFERVVPVMGRAGFHS